MPFVKFMIGALLAFATVVFVVAWTMPAPPSPCGCTIEGPLKVCDR